MGMDELILAMSNEDLATLKAKYSDNEAVTKLIEGILETREKAEAEARAKVEFEKGITKLFAKLPHPEDVHNVYVRWGEVEVEDTSVEGEAIEVINPDTQEVTTEMRYPKHTEYQWIVQVNKATKVMAGSGEAKTSKRGITVYKRVGLNLELVGHYASASKACEALSLPVGADSAGRVLDREAYIREPYDGTDYS